MKIEAEAGKITITIGEKDTSTQEDLDIDSAVGDELDGDLGDDLDL